MRGLDKWFNELTTDFTSVEFEDSRKAAYSFIDLIFQNDEYCHFRDVAFTVYNFCGQEKHCEADTILDNLQENAFSLITQITQVASIFKETSWDEMDEEAKGYALGTVGKTASAIFTDLWGFKPKK